MTFAPAPTRRVAVGQLGSVLFDTPATMERVVALVEEAAAAGVELLVLPEALIGGYPKGLNFGAHLGIRLPEGRDDYARYAASAVTLDGPEIAQLGELTQQHNLTLVTGIIERLGGTLYCTAVTIGPEGGVLGIHRKLMPTASERLVWGFGDGSTIEAVDTPVGRASMTICWENYLPQLRLATYQQGVELWCAPTVDDRDNWQATMRHIAVEGRCFVLAACQFLTRADAPEEYDGILGDDPETVLIRGGSVIISPLGEILAGPLYGESGLVVAELDPKDRVRGLYDLDVTGHYGRPDIFTLHVNTREQKGRVEVSGPAGTHATEAEEDLAGL